MAALVAGLPSHRHPTSGGALFHDLITVDFSAAAVPRTGRDSIWLAHRRPGSAVRTVNPRTRAAAFEAVGSLLEEAVGDGRRVLVGADFSFGYPSGFATCTAPIGSTDPSAPPWRRTWELLADLVEEGPDNANNRFAVADQLNRRTGTRLFWGRPSTPRHLSYRALPVRDVVPPGLAPNPCRQLRLAERLAGRGIRSNFQLFGGVTVGGQVLVGIPWLARLVERFRSVAVVWPFESGFVADPLAHPLTGDGGAATTPAVVFAELWPSLFEVSPPTPQSEEGLVRDERQVVRAAEVCAGLDRAGWAAWFDPASVAELTGAELAAVRDEEGWILGVA